MSDFKAAYGGPNALTVTNLHSLASSATAGWQSDEVSNSSNYLDVLVQVIVNFANTAIGGTKALYVYAAGGLETGKLSNPASGAQGAITLVDVTTTPQNLRQIGIIPYTTVDEVAESSPLSLAAAFGSVPPFWSIVIVNHTGAALEASGNTVKWTGVYSTVL